MRRVTFIYAWQRLTYLRDLWCVLVGRDMKLRYKRSALGMLWSLLNPLAQLLILLFIFTLILPLDIPNYTAFLFCGLLTWNWFHASLHQATSTIVDNHELLQRPGFPAAILPIVTVTANLIHLLMALPILLVFLWLGHIQFTGAILVLPLLLATQFLLILSMSYFLAAWHVTFRDTQHLLGVALLLGFYVTPIFYETRSIPPRYEPLFRLNPMVHLLEAYRNVLIRGELPNGMALLAVSVATIILFMAGYRFFRLTSYRFVDEF